MLKREIGPRSKDRPQGQPRRHRRHRRDDRPGDRDPPRRAAPQSPFAARPAASSRSSATAREPARSPPRPPARPGSFASAARSRRPTRRRSEREQLLLAGAPAEKAIQAFATASPTSCLAAPSPTFPMRSARSCRATRLRFDPASGLFGLVPVRSGGPLDKPEVRHLLSEAIDRDAFDRGAGRSGPRAAREPCSSPGSTECRRPPRRRGSATPLADRVAELQARGEPAVRQARRSRPIRVALPQGPGADLLFALLQRDWGALGFTVERAELAGGRRFRADRRGRAFVLAGLVRAPLPLRRGAGLRPRGRPADGGRARNAGARPTLCAARPGGGADRRRRSCSFRSPRRCAGRWSRAGSRASPGTAYARHTLTDLEQKPDSGD